MSLEVSYVKLKAEGIGTSCGYKKKTGADHISVTTVFHTSLDFVIERMWPGLRRKEKR
jgi:hypothetical protein